MNDVERFATDDGLSLAYRDEGSGLPLLCLPGLTRNMGDFDWLAQHFADKVRLIRMDKRGRGQSDRDPNPANYNILREGRDALCLLDHLGLEAAALLGTSRGGLIAMALAASAKPRLLGVCLNDVGPVIEPEGMAFIGSYLGVPPPYADHDQAADALTLAMATKFPRVTRARWRAFAERAWVQGETGLELSYDPRLREAVLGDERDAGEATPPDAWPLFDALEGLPLALIRAANSDILGAATAAEMRRRRPDMIFVEVPDTGHVPFLDEPESQAAIDAFLAKLAA